MRYTLLFALSILASVQVGRSQCAPNNPTGNFGFFPSTELLACVDKGAYYDETFYLENVDSFVIGGFSVVMEFLRIDSIGNLPCNLNWITNKGSNSFGTGETGCIRIFGQTNDTTGQYKLDIFVTLRLTVLGELQGEINKIITDLERLINTSLGVDFRYFIRVKEPIANCPAIDYDTISPLLRTAARSCTIAGLVDAQIIGDTILCRSANGQLDLSLSNVTNPSIEWIPANAVSNPFASTTNISLSNSDYVTVVVTDTGNTGAVYIDRTWIQVDTAAPLASTLAPIINGRNIKLESSSLNSTSTSWTLGDQTVKTGTSILHTYAADGIYPITLTVTNACGTDVYYDTLFIGNVGVSDIAKTALQCTIYPNPTNTNNIRLNVSGLQLMEEVTVQVMDLSGKMVLQPQSFEFNPSQPLNISVAGLQSGIYVFQVKTLHSSAIKKLIIY